MRPKKRLSQNFLIDDKASRKIVESLDLKPEDTVLEIGAGKGALTKHLLEKANQVLAVEIDQSFCVQLKQKFSHPENLQIINADILKINFQKSIQPNNQCKVVGNLPYRITSPSFDPFGHSYNHL